MARKYSSAGGSSPVTVQDEEYIEISSDSDSDCTLKGDNEISQKRLPVVAPAHKKPGLAHKKLGGLVHKKPPVDIPVHQKSGLAREKLGGLAHENLGIGASSPGAVQRHECIDLSSDTDCSEDSDNTLTGDSGNIRKMSGMDLSADGGDEKRVPGSEKSVDNMDTSPDREAETKGVPESAKTAGEEASKERVHESEKAVDKMDLSPEGEADRKGVPESEKTAGGEASKERVPESEKTAENGWIEIFARPNAPYDYDEDPLGLYGGEEVDDRPSIMEYYHQDARTNQIYAKMAPTKAELDAKAEAEATKDLAEENAGESSSASPSLSPGPTLADDPSEGKRSYVDALKGSTSKPASTTKRTARLDLRAPKSGKEKVLAVFDEWQKDKVTKTRDDEIADIQEAIDASLAFQEATKPGRELPDVVDLTAYRTVEEMNDLEEALRVSKALAEEEDAEFRKAIEASMMDDDSAQPKQAPPPNTPDDKFREEPNFEAECGTGKDEEMVDPDADFQKATNTSTMNEPSPKRKRSGTRTPGDESTEYSVPNNSPHTPAKSMKSNADEETPRKIRRRIQRERVELEKALGSYDNGSGQGGNGAD